MMNGSDSAVVFFSRDGNTRLGAQILLSRIGGKLIELKERKKGNFLQALFKMQTPLEGDPWRQIADARRVILMLPIWAGNGVPAMNAFIRKADFTDKDVFVITFQQFTDKRLSRKVHQYIAGIVSENHGSVQTCFALIGGKMGHCASEEHIRAQIALVKLPEGGAQEDAAGQAQTPEPAAKMASAPEETGAKTPAASAPEPENASMEKAAAAPEEPIGDVKEPFVEPEASTEDEEADTTDPEAATEETALPDAAAPEVPGPQPEEMPEKPLSAEEAFDEKTPAREAPPMP